MGRSYLCHTQSFCPPSGVAPRERGVAMMLVIISVTVATILAAAVLSSRNNSAAIGDNAADGASSAWAAESAAQYSIALLETGADWFAQLAENGGTNSVLLDDFGLAGAIVDITLTRMDGSAPAADDVELMLTATATVNGMVTTVKKIVAVSPPQSPEDAMDPELSEFAVYAKDSFEIGDGALLAAWDLSPKSVTNPMIKVGGKFATTADVVVSPTAIKPSAGLFIETAAPSSVKDLVECADWPRGKVMPVNLPVCTDRIPAQFALLPLQGVDVRLNADIPFTITVPGRYGACDLAGRAEMTLDDTYGNFYAFTSMRLTNQAVMRIKGQVSILVSSDFEVSGLATIELVDETSWLAVFVLDQFLVSDAGVGISRDIARSSPRKPGLLSEYQNPKRIQFQGIGSMHGGVDGADWRITGNSLAMCAINAPTKIFNIDNESILIGRVTGGAVSVTHSSRILFDPNFDSNQGFTTLSGPLYQRDGAPLANLQSTMDTFDWSQGHLAFKSHFQTLVSGGTIFDDSSPEPDTVAPRDDALCDYRPLAFAALLQEVISTITGSSKTATEEEDVMAQGTGDETTVNEPDTELTIKLPLLGDIRLVQF